MCTVALKYLWTVSLLKYVHLYMITRTAFCVHHFALHVKLVFRPHLTRFFQDFSPKEGVCYECTDVLYHTDYTATHRLGCM